MSEPQILILFHPLERAEATDTNPKQQYSSLCKFQNTGRLTVYGLPQTRCEYTFHDVVCRNLCSSKNEENEIARLVSSFVFVLRSCRRASLVRGLGILVGELYHLKFPYNRVQWQEQPSEGRRGSKRRRRGKWGLEKEERENRVPLLSY